MKKTIKIVLVILLIGSISGVAFYTFRKSPDSVKNIKPDFIVDAILLADEFSENENEANSKYLNKIVQVTGPIADIVATEDQKTIIYLEGNIMGNVSCLFSNSGLKNKDLTNGATITVKGKCAGYIMDVVLNKCAVVD
jgi:hypothetical protein